MKLGQRLSEESNLKSDGMLLSNGDGRGDCDTSAVGEAVVVGLSTDIVSIVDAFDLPLPSVEVTSSSPLLSLSLSRSLSAASVACSQLGTDIVVTGGVAVSIE